MKVLCITTPSGQAYVALSRATTLEGLQVLNFDEAKVRFLYCLGKRLPNMVLCRFKLTQKLLSGAKRFLQYRIHSGSAASCLKHQYQSEGFRFLQLQDLLVTTS